ncbi:MAG: formylglycine-generating enzyme family protein [Scytonema sp. PMC 1069.18]|nr:formylglycine-generating enzyme family protein [Scytonema sp. PMC 1069.18]MEC4885112.1 formylglycine-generating enzyme family protein [Scytonema sp. PMC 1070.18]
MTKQVTSPPGIASLSTMLKQVQLSLDGEEMVELLWLALQMGGVEEAPTQLRLDDENQSAIAQTLVHEFDASQATPPPVVTDSLPTSVPAYLPKPSPEQAQKKTASQGMPFKAPAAPGLRNSLALARALRPLMRKVPSQTKTILDEEETVTQIAEQGVWTPVLKPAPERWLDVVFVIEESRSISIWQEIITEFQKLTELQGAFRSVYTWCLRTDEDNAIRLFPKQNLSANQQRPRSPKELLDPAGRRLILLISDCISPIWRQGKIHDLLKLWSNSAPFAIIQLLPERLWMRTAMGFGFPVQLSASAPGVANTQLIVDGLPVWEDVDVANAIILPVITLEAESLKQWTRVVAGVGNTRTAGILFDLSLIDAQSPASIDSSQFSPAELVNRFRATASPIARRLAGLMAAVPVSLPVVHLIQETLLKESTQVHVAEVFMSGIIQPLTSDSVISQGEFIQYKFVEGVKELLIDSVPIPDTETVLEEVSQYIARKLGLSIKNFTALLSSNPDWDKAKQEEIIPFAQIATQTLYRLGGDYAALAKQLERKSQVVPRHIEPSNNSPQFLTFEFEVATIIIEDEENTIPEIDLQPFEFEVATIELKQSGWFRRKTELVVNRRRQQAWSYIENLENGVQLEMVAIPEGSFLMGSPEDEPERLSRESPQHRVTIKPFFLGKYPITQAQWQAVASLPQVNRKLDPNPSRFKGENRPVENVSWRDTIEFCERVSQYTRKPYRLPSEAEWEYACRGGTTTPFHFGETITSDLANYNANYTYGQGPKGIFRKQTTPVGSFGVANAFGLYDMHGNIWEWCADHWHENYEGAPVDEIPWLKIDNDNQIRLLRGGSWNNDPEFCRSAYRNDVVAGLRLNSVGFRVACAAA